MPRFFYGGLISAERFSFALVLRNFSFKEEAWRDWLSR